MGRPWLALLALSAWLGCPGCGPDARLVAAQQTVSVTAGTVAEAEVTLSEAGGSAGGELEEAQAAYEAAAGWQRRIESMVDVWERSGAGDSGYRLYSGCLRGALERLREAYVDAGLEPPGEIDQSIELLTSDARTDCADPG